MFNLFYFICLFSCFGCREAQNTGGQRNFDRNDSSDGDADADEFGDENDGNSGSNIKFKKGGHDG